MMKYTSLLFIFGLISLCFREIINMNSSIQNQFKICKKLKEEVPALNLNCRELLRKQIEESSSIENISLDDKLQLLKNKRTDISLLELAQENFPQNKIFNIKKETEKDREQEKEHFNTSSNDDKSKNKYNNHNNNFGFHAKSNENFFGNNNNNEEEIVNNESYDENMHNLHRIEKIENLMNVINGNVNFINLELKSIKNSLMKKRRTNYIKQKPNRINQEDRIKNPNTDKDDLITSEAVLREIEKLKTGHKNNSSSKDKNADNENINKNANGNKKNNSNFKKAEQQDKRALLQIKSFNDLNLDLDSLEKNKDDERYKNKNKENKQTQDLNDIIEGFKKKQATEELNLNKKKFHKQVTLNDKQEKLESSVNHVMELLNQLKVDNQDVFSQIKNKIAAVEKANKGKNEN